MNAGVWLTAIKEALNHLGAKSVAIALPYAESSNELLAKFLVHSGFKVVSQKGLNVKNPAFLPPENALKLSKEVNRPEADVILISCTNFRSLEVIGELEKDLGKPVISSNTACMWKVSQLAGLKEKVAGPGRLFQ
jgi:maleate isomerase